MSADRVWAALKARYAEPHRAYHTLAHIEDCLAKLDDVDGLAAEDRRRLIHAIWWHDAIYDPMRGDNEDRSAALAEADLPALGEAPDHVREVARLIRLTKGHEVGRDDRLGAVMVSIDLSILGAEPEPYRSYARAIRREYAHVPEDAYRAGRIAVLRRFLEAKTLFPYPAMAERLDAAARRNLSAEIRDLEAGPPV